VSDAPLGSLGRYRLVRRLGSGGMAEVFEARADGAAGVTKSLCVKRILPAFAGDRRFVRMFVSEARIAMALDHGNIAQVFDFGQEGRELFLAMELVDGHSLARVHRQVRRAGLRFPVPLALQIVREVCKALHHAHERVDEQGRRLAIVHRDVSPQNVLLAYDGQVKLVDFGIARASSVAATGGGLVGKVPYMAPEQARGEEVDRRADVFGCGAVLFELLSGRTPIDPSTDPVLFQISDPTIPSLSDVAPDVDPVLAALVDRALAADRGARFPSALAFQEALAAYVERRRLRANEEDVGRLVRYLFADDLEAAERTLDVPPDFVDGLSAWRDGSVAAPPSGRRQASWVAAGAVAALVVALVVFLSSSDSRAAWEVEVRSQPPGARILLDGEDTGVVTDGVITGLEAGRIHRITLEREGYLTYDRNLLPGQSAVVAALDPEPPVREVPAAVPAAPTRRAGSGTRTPVIEVTREEGGVRTVRLDRSRATVAPTQVQALWMDLVSDGPYTLEVQGSLMITIGRDLYTVAWIALGSDGALLDGGLVRVGHPVTVPSGSRRLAVMSLRGRGTCAVVAGHMRATVRSGERRVAGGEMDIQRHCIAMDEHVEGFIGDLPNDRGHRIRYEGPADGPLILLAGASLSPRALALPHDEAFAALWPGDATFMNFVESVYVVGIEPPEASESPVAILRFEPGALGRALARED
jgi:hypothetical protein